MTDKKWLFCPISLFFRETMLNIYTDSSQISPIFNTKNFFMMCEKQIMNRRNNFSSTYLWTFLFDSLHFLVSYSSIVPFCKKIFLFISDLDKSLSNQFVWRFCYRMKDEWIHLFHSNSRIIKLLSMINPSLIYFIKMTMMIKIFCLRILISIFIWITTTTVRLRN